jgi:hypothetical protein
MIGRLKKLGIVLTLFGLVFVIGGGYAYLKVLEGERSLKAFSAAQGVELTYNKEGQLTDRGTTEGAGAIMALLVNDWGYPSTRLSSTPMTRSSTPAASTCTRWPPWPTTPCTARRPSS